MRKKVVLIVEDNPYVREILGRSLEILEYKVRKRASLAEVSGIGDMTADLLLLDIDLPDGNGVEFCRTLRDRGITMPVIFVTGDADIRMKVEGLRCGDDYIVKPFDLEEVAARIEVVLRRRAEETATVLGAARLFPGARRLTFPAGSVRLSRAETRLVEFMMRRPGAALSVDVIFRGVWGERDSANAGGDVRALIARTRKKLGKGSPLRIYTDGKSGYTIASQP